MCLFSTCLGLRLAPIVALCRKGKEWKRTRSNASKQVVPRRVGNFVEPLSVIANELLSYLEAIKDESGTVADITPECLKWAFQGTYAMHG